MELLKFFEGLKAEQLFDPIPAALGVMEGLPEPRRVGNGAGGRWQFFPSLASRCCPKA